MTEKQLFRKLRDARACNTVARWAANREREGLSVRHLLAADEIHQIDHPPEVVPEPAETDDRSYWELEPCEQALERVWIIRHYTDADEFLNEL